MNKSQYQQSPPPEDVRQYMLLGHTGYIIDYRTRHAGVDPDPNNLQVLARRSDNMKCGPIVRIVKGVIDLIT